MTFIERFMVRRGHPRYLILHLVGAIWAFYFLWLHNWILVVVMIGACELLSQLSVLRANSESLAQTVLGK